MQGALTGTRHRLEGLHIPRFSISMGASEHQHNDREQMPMALMQKLANRLCSMDETEMISASLLAWAECMCCWIYVVHTVYLEAGTHVLPA